MVRREQQAWCAHGMTLGDLREALAQLDPALFDLLQVRVTVKGVEFDIVEVRVSHKRDVVEVRSS